MITNTVSARFIDMSGQKFNRLLVTTLSEERTKSGGLMWNCICDCGNSVRVSAHDIRSEHTKSCGCLKTDKLCLPPEEASFNALYYSYKTSAEMRKGTKHRNLPFDLSKEFFKKITGMNCFYCGVVPARIIPTRQTNGIYPRNGIDRVDSSKGYVENNVVPCCKRCNVAKNDMSILEFKEWLSAAYNNLVKE